MSIESIKKDFETELNECSNLKQLEELRIKYRGIDAKSEKIVSLNSATLLSFITL